MLGSVLQELLYLDTCDVVLYSPAQFQYGMGSRSCNITNFSPLGLYGQVSFFLAKRIAKNNQVNFNLFLNWINSWEDGCQ